MANTIASTKQIIMSDMFTDNEQVGNRLFKVVDGVSAFSEAFLGARGVAYLSDWINDANHAGGTKLYSEFIAPADKWLVIEADGVYTDSPSLVLSVYNDYTATAGANHKVLPFRAGAPNVDNIPSTSVFRRVTAPVINTASLVSRLPLFSTPSGNTGGASAGNSFVRLLPPNSPFLIELDNRNNSTHYSQFQIRWSEIPAEYLPNVGV